MRTQLPDFETLSTSITFPEEAVDAALQLIRIASVAVRFLLSLDLTVLHALEGSVFGAWLTTKFDGLALLFRVSFFFLDNQVTSDGE